VTDALERRGAPPARGCVYACRVLRGARGAGRDHLQRDHLGVREEGGQWQRALALLDEMRAARVAPDVITSQRDHLGPLRLYCVDPQQSEGLEVEQLARCVRQH
jgi:hypothetical protein